MEFAILFILTLLLIFYNNWLRREHDDFSESQPTPVVSQPKPLKKVEKVVTHKPEEKKQEVKPIPQPVKEPKIKRKLRMEEVPKVSNPKDALLNTFRDGKDLKNVNIYNEGKLILSSDVKCEIKIRKKRYMFSYWTTSFKRTRNHILRILILTLLMICTCVSRQSKLIHKQLG